MNIAALYAGSQQFPTCACEHGTCTEATDEKLAMDIAYEFSAVTPCMQRSHDKSQVRLARAPPPPEEEREREIDALVAYVNSTWRAQRSSWSSKQRQNTTTTTASAASTTHTHYKSRGRRRHPRRRSHTAHIILRRQHPLQRRYTQKTLRNHTSTQRVHQ